MKPSSPQIRSQETHSPGKGFPSMLFEDKNIINFNSKIRKKYLIFRVYEDPIQMRPY